MGRLKSNNVQRFRSMRSPFPQSATVKSRVPRTCRVQGTEGLRHEIHLSNRFNALGSGAIINKHCILWIKLNKKAKPFIIFFKFFSKSGKTFILHRFPFIAFSTSSSAFLLHMVFAAAISIALSRQGMCTHDDAIIRQYRWKKKKKHRRRRLQIKARKSEIDQKLS
ncbi:predicted protein [Arabidopsis lyrata subsp. lyrata]|uniref:Predicted protein n=1 Tax=Arabidopsis lyrata subsp. lyrata TaxID=81972 RepID=D7M2G4_ARALL|nr:predicted protein [Arabidopsis lyrata subsp. lyrata]